MIKYLFLVMELLRLANLKLYRNIILSKVSANAVGTSQVQVTRRKMNVIYLSRMDEELEEI